MKSQQVIKLPSQFIFDYVTHLKSLTTSKVSEVFNEVYANKDAISVIK